jgi:hypothetical protein
VQLHNVAVAKRVIAPDLLAVEVARAPNACELKPAG